MKVKKLLAPDWRVSVGQYEITDGMAVECFSSGEARADWCRITLDDAYEGLIEIHDMEGACIELGYSDTYDTLMEGSVRMAHPGGWKEILVLDGMRKLAETEIMATFLECRPEDVIKYILRRSGITDYALDETVYETKSVFALDSRNGIQAIQAVNSFWGIGNAFFFRGKKFHWGAEKAQEEMYVLEEGENLIQLEKTGSLWEAETFGIPWLHHGDEVEIAHSMYEGVAKIQKTVIKRSEKGTTRMRLYF